MTQYLIRFPLFLLVIILRYPLAFIAVGWQKDKQLQTPFKWLDTIDNSLDGDAGWKAEHLWPTSNPSDYFNQVRWLWRNGGNKFNYFQLGVSAESRPAWAFWKKSAIPLLGSRFLDVRFGWSDYVLQGRSKYVFTIRIKTKP